MIANISTSSFSCRSCGSSDVAPVLSLGETPLANRLLTAEQVSEPEPRYPLDVVFCRNCCLVQITETVPPEELFRDYVYFSSFSDAMLRHAETLVTQVRDARELTSESLVVEIASNDGYLLQFYAQLGIPVLGIEPARNIAEVARTQRNIPTISEFFDEELATRLSNVGQRADVVHAHNVLAHVADLNGVVAGVARLLKPTGVWIVEVPWVCDLIDHVEFDTIYHEHLCYFSLASLKPLIERHGLSIVDAEHVPIHGGTLRLHIGQAGRTSPSERLWELCSRECEWGVTQYSTYRDFGDQVASLREKLTTTLRELKASGRRIAAYGASAKGSTLLNSFGIGRDVIDFVVDRSTVKQGHFTPGTHLPICAPEKLVEDMPDDVLLLTWNFRDEILAQQDGYRRKGGRFIVPLPEVTIV